MQHEQSFADIFRTFMQTQAKQHGCRFHSFSLDGQDRDAGADYVLTDSDRFAMIEFKYSQSGLVSEKYKPRRLTLCQKLLVSDEMRQLHDKCHFISWTEGPSKKVKLNVYRKEICTEAVFGVACGLSAMSPDLTTQTLARQFAVEFFSIKGTKSLSLAEFEFYIEWVLQETSASTSSLLELVAYNPTSNDLALVHLGSIAEAQTWVKTHIPVPPTERLGMGYGI